MGSKLKGPVKATRLHPVSFEPIEVVALPAGTHVANAIRVSLDAGPLTVFEAYVPMGGTCIGLAMRLFQVEGIL